MLMRGEVGSAIASFRVAAQTAEFAAPAHNGLGAAYAMIGRGDLAERYFYQAIAEDPNEPKYAANLSRYYKSRDAALAKQQSTQPAIVLSEAQLKLADGAVAMPVERDVPTHSGAIARVTTAAPQTTITRVSSREVTLRTLPAATSARLADGRRVNPGYSAVRRPTQVTYPVRVELGR
jgi:hypothetical protein